MSIKNYAEAWIDQYANQLPTVNFVAGDYTSLKESIRQYVTLQCPEDYNDWANSSECGIFVNGLSYLGSIINYRVDLNAHDIFPSTTERRQSLLNFVKILSYSPKRNIAALGIAKITSIRTTEGIYDSLGNSLQEIKINWNDSANPNWQEQFLTILNRALSSTNPFGKPLKKMSYNGISTQTYELNNLKNNSCVYSFTSVVNGSVKQFEVVNADLDTELYTIEEKTPIPEQGFNILYRTDGTGNSSSNTGFFVYWKQGNLKSQNIQFDEKIENNYFNINETNINNYDVWFQSINSETGLVKENWEKIPANEYLVYNNLDTDIRNIYRVESNDNDTITLRFSDGKFGTIPVGYFRVWYRISAGNDDMYIKPGDISNINITIPYKSSNSSDVNTYYLTLEFTVSNSEHITQSVPQESMEYIRERAPELYSTQNRMVTGSDYNYFPKSYTQRIKLLKSIVRTYSGNTRYIDFNDPTGTYQDLQLLGTDGYIYSNSGLSSLDIPSSDWTNVDELIEMLNKELRKISLSNFYYENFPTKEAIYRGMKYKWREIYNYGNNSSVGYFAISSDDEEFTSIPYEDVANTLKVGSLIRMVVKNEFDEIINESWITINSIKENTLFDSDDDHTQEIIINDSLDLNSVWEIDSFYEPFNITFSTENRREIYNLFFNNTSFGLRYNTNINELEIMPYNSLSNGDFIIQDITSDEDNGCTDWILRINYKAANTWSFDSRYLDYIFGSANDMSFFFNTSIKNNNGTFYTEDYIKVLKNQSNDDLDLEKDYYWKPCNVIMYTDGYIDPNRFKIYGYDEDKDSTIDNPIQFREIASQASQKLFFGKDVSGEDSVLYKDVIEIPTMWSIIKEGEYKNYSATNVSNNYYLNVPCTVYPAGIKIPYRQDGSIIKIYAVDDITLSDGHTLYATDDNPVLIAESGNIYNYDVVDVGHIVEYVIDSEGNTIIPQDTEEKKYDIRTESVTSGNLGEYDPETQTYVCENSSGDEKYRIYTNDKTLVYWSSTDNKMDIVDKNNYVIKSGVKDIIYLWKHFSTMKYLIDPSTTNIIDMYVLTKEYWNNVQTWINNGKKDVFPKLPSEYELRSQFMILSNYKMMSDTMIWHPISYKLLFGNQASEEVKGIFKIIKNDNTTLSDNEIKQQVVKAIDEYFSNMEPGETFYFTQLSSYIHKKLGNNINTPLLVPTYNDEKFGNLFEIHCEPDEILLSSASIDDIQIISKITDYNIRISQ